MKYYDGGIPIVNVRLVNEGRIGGEEKVVMPMQAVKLIGREISDLAREAVYVINLDIRGRVLSIHLAGLGMTTGTYISGKEIFLPALLTNAASIIIVHNHPGQDPTPSQTDKEFTLMIWKMFAEGERVTIPKLVAKTKLSKGFFYKNPEVRKELDRIQDQQVGLTDPRRNILDMAMDSEIARLNHQIRQQAQEIDRLSAENTKLKKALEKKAMSLIRTM